MSKYTRKRCRRLILKTVRQPGLRRRGETFVFYLECGHSVRHFGCHVRAGQKGAYCTTCEAIADAKQP